MILKLELPPLTECFWNSLALFVVLFATWSAMTDAEYYMDSGTNGNGQKLPQFAYPGK